MEQAERPEAIDHARPNAPVQGAGKSDGERPIADSDTRRRFERLIADELDRLYRSALRLTRNPAAAEDLTQEVMVKAWRSFHTFQPGTSMRAWLHRILMNAFFDSYRKQTRQPDVVDQDDVDDLYLYDKALESETLRQSGDPAVELLDNLMDDEVRDSLEALPPQFRAAVMLADVEGFSYKEIAEALGIPIGTVMSRLSRGRHLLRRRLSQFARDRHFVKGDGR
jgi:RNA polymerase sigma-70 factor, ECF subfamily